MWLKYIRACGHRPGQSNADRHTDNMLFHFRCPPSQHKHSDVQLSLQCTQPVDCVLIKLILIFCYQLFGASCFVCLGKSTTRRWLWRYLPFLLFLLFSIDERAETCVIGTKCFTLKSSAPEPVYEEPETGYGPPDDG